jgi:hypothetical protein
MRRLKVTDEVALFRWQVVRWCWSRVKGVLFAVFVWLAFIAIVLAVGFVAYLVTTRGHYNGP